MNARAVAAAGRRAAWAWPPCWFAAVLLALLVIWVALTAASGDLRPSQDGAMLVNVLVFGAVGGVIMWRRPENAVGWILAGVSLLLLFNLDTKLYSVLDYRIHEGGLPLGRAALDFDRVGPSSIVLGMVAVLLFPDGRLEGGWRRAIWIYVALAAFLLAGQFGGEATLHLGRQVPLDSRGRLASSADQTGWWGVSILALPVLVGFWIAFIVHQVRSWRRADGVQREQLKWLLAGAIVTFLATVTFLLTASGTGGVRIIGGIAALAIGSFPLSIGVGILKYRLYEIDRLISRTISYALLTGLLAGVFIGLVLLTTRVLPFSSPVGVAASTLAAAALFSPLRRRLQRLVDHRFNRARYDADATVTAFAGRLRNAIDLDSISTALLDVIDTSVAPAHTTLWICATIAQPQLPKNP